jgi:hypothetical protein
MHRVLILGGYGFFGSRIATALARHPRIQLLIGGRDLTKATALAYQLGLSADHARALDATSAGLAQQLKKLQVQTLIHTAGPFQGQNYAVARAAIAAGANYLDLADGREFVKGIASLDAAARAAGVLVVSGVSSLPALSAAVVDRYLPEFSRLDAIRIGITSGGVVPGRATLEAVLGYTGQPFRVLQDGAWREVYGWLDTIRHEFPKVVGPRLLGRCDVPDLDLLPERYKGVRTVSFHAGFASDGCHRAVEKLAQWVRDGKLASAQPLAKYLWPIARLLKHVLSDRGAMFVRLEGIHAHNTAPHTLTWNLVARENHGPNIPCAASIALTRKIANGASLPAGAMPCLGLLDVQDMLDTLKGMAIRELPPLEP